MNRHAFSIESTINPTTGKPFGPKFGGAFTIRRPNFADKKAITLKDAAAMQAYGPVDTSQLGGGFVLIHYIYTFVTVIAEEKLPEWFDMERMYDDDCETAILEVWKEVGKFLDTFRSETNSSAGSAGSEAA